MSTPIEELNKLLKNIHFNHTRLHEKNVKKASVDTRKDLQRMIVVCKQLRKDCLAHCKSIPVKKRKPKAKTEKDETPELPVPDEVNDEVR
jgi:hypothetical protein